LNHSISLDKPSYCSEDFVGVLLDVLEATTEEESLYRLLHAVWKTIIFSPAAREALTKRSDIFTAKFELADTRLLLLLDEVQF
jgi:hypothetical protein